MHLNKPIIESKVIFAFKIIAALIIIKHVSKYKTEEINEYVSMFLDNISTIGNAIQNLFYFVSKFKSLFIYFKILCLLI